MLTSGRIIPIAECWTFPNYFDSLSSFWQCLETVLAPLVCRLVCRLRINGFNWIWLVILDPFDFNWLMLCPWALSFFQSTLIGLCPLSCFMLISWPSLGPQCCFYNLLEGQPGNSWPLRGKYCTIANPSRYSGLHLPCFLYVQHQHFSVNPLGWATGAQCLPKVRLLVASFQGQLGFQG